MKEAIDLLKQEKQGRQADLETPAGKLANKLINILMRAKIVVERIHGQTQPTAGELATSSSLKAVPEVGAKRSRVD